MALVKNTHLTFVLQTTEETHFHLKHGDGSLKIWVNLLLEVHDQTIFNGLSGWAQCLLIE